MIRDQSYQHEIVTTIQSVRCLNTFSIIMVYPSTTAFRCSKMA